MNDHPCVNSILIDKHIEEQDKRDKQIEFIIQANETKRLTAINAISDYISSLKEDSDEAGLSHDWFTILEDLELK